MKYEVIEKQEGCFLLVRGVKIEGKWFRTDQFQLVNGRWTTAGCHWYTTDQIKEILKKGAVVETGDAKIEEVDGYRLLVTKDEDGIERLV
jgi:hypothetical protein